MGGGRGWKNVNAYGWVKLMGGGRGRSKNEG